jgi:hypothetical protein
MSIFSTCAEHDNGIIPAGDDEPAVEDTTSINDDPVVEDTVTIYYEDNETEGTVAYKRCREYEPSPINYFPRGEAYYFKDSIPDRLKTELRKCWTILYDTKTEDVTLDLSNISYLYDVDANMPVHGLICNFPDFAKAWDIPENGCKVSFEGIKYPPSRGGTADYVPMDYVLSILRKIES